MANKPWQIDHLDKLVSQAAERISQATGNPCTYDPLTRELRGVDADGKDVVMKIGAATIFSYRMYNMDNTPFLAFDEPEQLVETLEGMITAQDTPTL